MSFGTFVVLFLLLCLVLGFWASINEAKKDKLRSPKERMVHRKRLEQENLNATFGLKNSPLLCPHCQEKGGVRTKSIKTKKGVSGGKATGAILTGGVSLLATGLSRKEAQTQANCENCGSTWAF